MQTADILALHDHLRDKLAQLERTPGPQGPQGERGKDGKDGADGVSIRGPEGPRGPQGPQGESGKDGKDGQDGKDGDDGVSVTDAEVSFDGHLTLRLSDGNEIDAGLIHAEGDQHITIKKGGGGGGGSSGGGGFCTYLNGGAAQAVAKDTWVQLENDGDTSNEQYKPEGISTFLGTDAIDPSSVSLGSGLLITPDFTVTPTVNNTLVEFRYNIAGGTYVDRVVGRLDSGAGVGYRFALQTDHIGVLTTDIRDNPITLEIRTNESCSVQNNGWTVQLIKR
jgi:hypothetical protein